ncbi:MAG: gamma-glutamylcyclotransferase [Methyloceanibacter sp.]|jgi:glutathione-specific gamma-glutamylcyclotransferase|nr:gamma-glutamylcyclotransferase [Methyloceanibacter sp.]
MAELWVFAYGSLMWQPGFAFSEQAPAALIGAHRSLCIYSFHHRGTTEHPGLVLGLDEGGACRGVAFRVVSGKKEATLAYLRAREQVTDVYVERTKPVSLLDGSGRELEALCYMVDRGHPQYAGRLSIETQARLVRSAAGRSGTNLDYVLNTVRHLEEAGIDDVELMALAQRLAAGKSAPRK